MNDFIAFKGSHSEFYSSEIDNVFSVYYENDSSHSALDEGGLYTEQNKKSFTVFKFAFNPK